ncbi:MAG: DUF3078 domain-containing protein [Bacteroidaceae bacterium]|nr:DUF3078 domain-containing protein [Bacteroidaceae bacterium]
MKRRLTITWIFSVFLLTLSAQSTHNSRVMKEFADSLRELSASYFAYHRLWEDMDAPAPRGVKLKSDYYKLFVPPTYYFSPVEQAFAFDWEPGDRLGMNACDSIYAVKKDVSPVYELPNLEKTASVDRWVNKILLNFYLQHPEQVMGNEMYFADAILLDDVQVVNAPRQEKMKNYMQVSNPVEKANVENEFRVLKPNFWKKTAAASMQFSQYSISDNWYQGGESTNSLLSELKLTANYDDRQRVQFENSLEIKIGFITAPSDTVHKWKTNADLFRLNSKLGVRAIKNLYYTLTGEFKTQFFSNYKTNTNDLISSFLSPAQLKFSLGMDYKLEKSKYKLSLMGAPLSYTFIYISNDKIINPSSFNVDPGHTSANMFGSEITANLTWQIANNISWVSKFEYFTTYEKVIANWENTFEFKLNRYLSTKFFLHSRFDDGVTLSEDNDTYFQFKEMLTFGLSYTW